MMVGGEDLDNVIRRSLAQEMVGVAACPIWESRMIATHQIAGADVLRGRARRGPQIPRGALF